MRVNLSTIRGETFVVEAEPNDTVDRLREIVERHTGIPKDVQRMICKGKDMLYHNTLEFYNVDPTATVFLVLLPAFSSLSPQ